MTLQNLKHFVSFVEEKTEREAGLKCFCSYSSIQQSIKHLEFHLGYELLIRSNVQGGKKLSIPTMRGDILYKKAKILLSHYEEVSTMALSLK